jgi:hypothetical protein
MESLLNCFKMLDTYNFMYHVASVGAHAEGAFAHTRTLRGALHEAIEPAEMAMPPLLHAARTQKQTRTLRTKSNVLNSTVSHGKIDNRQTPRSVDVADSPTQRCRLPRAVQHPSAHAMLRDHVYDRSSVIDETV